MKVETLQEFRQAGYELLTTAKDATFELMDAVMTTQSANSLAEMSLSPLFRRKWSSVYEALEDSRPQRNKLMKLYLKQIEVSRAQTEGYIVVAIDHTAWGRREAKTLVDRTYEHQPLVKGEVIVGQGSSTIAWIAEEEGSWALPLRHERISSWESPLTTAAWQLKQVVKHSPHRIIALLDREYGNAKWVRAQAQIDCDCVMRVRKNACFWTAPPAYSGNGRPRKHGDKIRLQDPSSWKQEDSNLELDDPKLGAPGRVAASMFSLIIRIGTPARPPKTRGKSPGWTTGNKRTKKPRYPVAKKSRTRSKKSSKIAA